MKKVWKRNEKKIVHIPLLFLLSPIRPKHFFNSICIAFFMQAFTTKDGRYIMLGAGSDRQFQELSEVFDGQSSTDIYNVGIIVAISCYI